MVLCLVTQRTSRSHAPTLPPRSPKIASRFYFKEDRSFFSSLGLVPRLFVQNVTWWCYCVRVSSSFGRKVYVRVHHREFQEDWPFVLLYAHRGWSNCTYVIFICTMFTMDPNAIHHVYAYSSLESWIRIRGGYPISRHFRPLFFSWRSKTSMRSFCSQHDSSFIRKKKNIERS